MLSPQRGHLLGRLVQQLLSLELWTTLVSLQGLSHKPNCVSQVLRVIAVIARYGRRLVGLIVFGDGTGAVVQRILLLKQKIHCRTGSE